MKKYLMLCMVLFLNTNFCVHAQTCALENPGQPNNIQIHTLKSGKQKIKNKLKIAHAQVNDNYGRNDIMDAWIDLFGRHERTSYEPFSVRFIFMQVDGKSKWLCDTLNHLERKSGEVFYADSVNVYGWSGTIYATRYVAYEYNSMPVICIRLAWGNWAVIHYLGTSDIPSTDIQALLYYSLQTNSGINAFIRSPNGQKMYFDTPWNKVPKVVK
jgi:hypothetical protein